MTAEPNNTQICDIIRDLLPLYVEQVVSDSSRNFVEEHLQQCPACQQELEQLKKDITLPAEQDTQILQNFQRKLKRKIIRGSLITATILTVLFAGFIFLYQLELPCNYNEVQLEPSYGTIGSDKKMFSVQISCESAFAETGKSMEPTKGIHQELHYRIYKTSPLRNFLSTPFYCLGVGIPADWLNNTDSTDVLVLEFADRTVTYVNGVLQE